MQIVLPQSYTAIIALMFLANISTTVYYYNTLNYTYFSIMFSNHCNLSDQAF